MARPRSGDSRKTKKPDSRQQCIERIREANPDKTHMILYMSGAFEPCTGNAKKEK